MTGLATILTILTNYLTTSIHQWAYWLVFQELAKLLEDQHGYIDLQNIPENKYYSMDKNPDEDEKL